MRAHFYMKQIEIGKRISNLRQRKGLTETELADLVNIDPVVINEVERGICHVTSVEALLRILNALECSVEIVTAEEEAELEHIRAVAKAKATFKSYNAENESVRIFGDWAVNEVGDIVNHRMNYPIYCYLLNRKNSGESSDRESWVTHISHKGGFDVENFAEAYDHALSVILLGEAPKN